MTEELGPTRVSCPAAIARGGRPNGDTGWHGREEQSILCKAGDVVLFRSEVWHRGTANHSDRVRYLLQGALRANAGSHSAFRPTCTGSRSIPISWPSPATGQRRLMGDHPPGRLRLSFNPERRHRRN